MGFQIPIISIEDGLAEDDWDGWQLLTSKIGNRIQLVATISTSPTSSAFSGHQEQDSNSILIKLNQIGTLTETLAAIDMAHKAGWSAVVSHRSGETEDTTIADLAWPATAARSRPARRRSERTAKYNRLLRIEEELGKNAVYAAQHVSEEVNKKN